jgi:hypothetical protein
MPKYEVIFHTGVGRAYYTPDDCPSPDEAAEVTREMWARGEEGELLYGDVDRVEIKEIEPDPVEPLTTTEG